MVIVNPGYYTMEMVDHFCTSLSRVRIFGQNFYLIIGSSAWLCPTYEDKGTYDVEDLD